MAGEGGPQREEEFYYLLTEGSELLQAGKVDEARVHFERALEMNPSHEQALNLLGLALFRLAHLDRARQIFAELVHNNPIEPSLRLNLAMVHLKTGRLDDAKIELERVLELSPDHPRATSYMGLVLERKGDLDRAAGFYEKAGNKKRADEIRAYRPTATGTFPLPNLQKLIAAQQAADAQQPAPPEGVPTSQLPQFTPTAPPPAAAAAAPPPASAPPTAPRAAAPTSGGAAQPMQPVPSPGGTSSWPPPLPPLPQQSTPPAPAPSTTPRQAEAAALTAATAAQLQRKTEPPTPAAVETARGSSLGFTVEVDEKTRAAGAAPAPVTVLPTTAAAAAPAPAAAPGTTPIEERTIADLQALTVVAEQPHVRADGTLAFPVPDVGYVRTDMLVALAGQFEIEPVNRRYRGKRTDSLFGGPESAIVALLGKGLALLAPKDRSLKLLSLKAEELYLVEGALLAFTQGLVWENGRLPSESDRDLDIVHLRGTGRLILGTETPLLALQVRPDQPATVHASRLVGWNGQLVPYRAPLPGLPEAARRIPVVRFEGTGIVLAV